MAETIEFNVTGMTCDHCVHAVTTAVEGVAGVSAVQVSLDNKKASVQGDAIDTAAVIAAIAEEGYGASVAARA
jgi:copper chaperone